MKILQYFKSRYIESKAVKIVNKKKNIEEIWKYKYQRLGYRG